ncbi:2890_t:CDS:2, partial [Funneliformis geosporum]
FPNNHVEFSKIARKLKRKAAVIDSSEKFINIFVGYLSLTHNSRIFYNSLLYHKFSSFSFSVILTNAYILDNADVEQAFRRLKSRFMCLINPLTISIEIAILIVIITCILHNICEERQEDIVTYLTNSIRDNLANYLWNKKIQRDVRRNRYNFIGEGDEEDSETSK